MCVIMTAQEGRVIPEVHLKEGNSTNPHGWGIAVRYNVGESPVIERGFTTASLVDAYARLMQSKTDQTVSVVHCRITTHGETNIANTHPFAIGDDMWLFHNGTFNIHETDKTMSDTWHFAQGVGEMIAEFPADMRETVAGSSLFARTMGWCFGKVFSSWSKGTVITRYHTHIIEESHGVWRDSIWYSNSSAFPIVRRHAHGSEEELVPMGNGTFLPFRRAMEKFADRQNARHHGKKSQRNRNRTIDVAEYGATALRAATRGKDTETFMGDHHTCVCGHSYLYSIAVECPKCHLAHPEWTAYLEKKRKREEEAFDRLDQINAELDALSDDGHTLMPDAITWQCRGQECDGDCMKGLECPSLEYTYGG